ISVKYKILLVFYKLFWYGTMLCYRSLGPENGNGPFGPFHPDPGQGGHTKIKHIMDTKKKPRFIDPTTDYGFKRIFGTDTNKDLLIALLNGLFRGRKNITDLHYNKHEHVGDTRDMGTVIFDLTCTDGDGTQFIVEVQRSHHKNLRQRMVYYGCKLLTEQRPLGNDGHWDYGLGE